jgi:uncharacterized membrane protein HdeD (DUF308 family)
MWLSGPVYESLPYGYIVGGFLFLIGTVYADPGPPLDTVYMTLGVISILSGVFVISHRRAARAKKRRESEQA